MILKPSDLKKMVKEWLDAGYTVDLDLSTGKVKVQPPQGQRVQRWRQPRKGQEMSEENLDELIKRCRALVAAMTPQERAAMYAAQTESWVRGEMAIGLDRQEAEFRKHDPSNPMEGKK